jgi:hypothetical protein
LGIDLFEGADLPPILDEYDESTPLGGTRWAVAGGLVGWSVTLASIALVFGLLIRPEWTRDDVGPERLEIGPLVAETTRSGWLETSRSGFLLVYEGELRNTGRTPLQPVPLQLALLDHAGQRLPDPPIELGAPLEERTMREASPAVLAARRAEAITEWLASPLSPGEIRPFTAMATAAELPEAARRVRLEAGAAGVGSSGGVAAGVTAGVASADR